MSGASKKPNPGALGDAAEAAVQAELIRRGYSILVPWGNSTPYDLVVDADGFQSIQVKTGRVQEGGATVRFETSTSISTGKSYYRNFYSADDIDYFIVWCEELDCFFCVPFEDAPNYAMILRFDERNVSPQNAWKVNWASDYALDNFF